LKPITSFGIVFSKTWSLVKDAVSISWGEEVLRNEHEHTEFEHSPFAPVLSSDTLASFTYSSFENENDEVIQKFCSMLKFKRYLIRSI